MQALKRVPGSLALLVPLLLGACVTDEEVDGPAGEGQDAEVTTISERLWTCSTVNSTVFNHVFAGRAVSCGLGVYCAVGSGQQIGTVLTIGPVNVSLTNPGYYVAGGCVAAPRFAWPLGGTNGRAWVVNNYVDLDTTAAIRDYRNGTKSYNGHQGEDIVIANFRAMDAGVPVFAAAGGTVIDAHDGEFDRNTSCTGTANYVKLRHANGAESWYWHLRNGSVVATIGSYVSSGTKLGEVGSSGCSTDPHLHFEVHEYNNGAMIDPFVEGMFTSPPAYSTGVGVLDVAMMLGKVSNAAAKSPGINANLLNLGADFSTVMYTGNGLAGDTLAIQIMAPNGTQWARSANLTLSGTERQGRYVWWWTMGTGAARGTYTVRYLVNGTIARTLTFYAG